MGSTTERQMPVSMLLASVIASNLAVLLHHSPAMAQTITFVCGVSDGVPTTLAQTERGPVPVIHWRSQHFTNSGWSPERRCEAVSSRFQLYYEDGSLDHLTTGIINGEQVVCTAPAEDAPCENLLFTLQRSADPNQVLQELLAVRVSAGGALNQSTQRLYINVEDYLQTAPVDENASVVPMSSVPANFDHPPGASDASEPTLW